MLTRMIVQGLCAIIYAVEVAFVLLTSLPKYKEKYYLKTKMTCSLSFVVIGLIFAAVSAHWKYFFLLLPALVCCSLGDLSLGLYQTKKQKRQFIFGIIGFVGAHVGFLVSWFLLDSTFNAWNLVLPVIGLIVMYIMKKTLPMNFGKMWVPACAYSVFLMLMFAKGTQYMVRQPNISSAWIGVGAILFFISDFLINLIYFYTYKEESNKQIVGVINLATYFFALLAIDMSILYY